MDKTAVKVPVKDLNKILKAYRTIGDFLEHYISPKSLYKEEFIKGIDIALTEVSRKKTKKVKDFSDFVS
ncbi:hypothetical protein KAW65_00695 [candidate division WOR-3 bacterium]|nr:hypothetical protein [candidate division WOR-3 bacterium]